MKQDPICVLNPPLKYMPFYDVFHKKIRLITLINDICSSTLAIPVVKAGGFFAIPFVKGNNEKESVPLFVVTDSVNSFSMQIDAPDIKPTIEAGQLIIVAR